MTRPDDIPEDVWERAIAVADEVVDHSHMSDWPAVSTIARAILAERERCKSIAYQKSKQVDSDEACVACLKIAVDIVYGEVPAQ